MWAELLDVGTKVAGGVGLPAVVLYLVSQRRKARNENALAERTQNASVSKADSGALEAHVMAVERAFTAERESKDRQLLALREELAAVRTDCQERISAKDAIIADLRAEVGTLASDLAALRSRLGEA